MADIELVIKIDEEDYKIMRHNITINNPLCPLSQKEMVSKVANGTALPKGHGDLVDRDAVYHAYDYSNITMIKALQDAETIIEADGGDAE